MPQKISDDFIAKINKNKWKIILFLLIFSVGIFLRSYHFRSWLDFESDQARDLSITEKVVDEGGSWPLLGPDMSHSQDGSVRFHVGPMYYYFQIISGKFFGVRPETAAYPDLLFAILSIPIIPVFIISVIFIIFFVGYLIFKICFKEVTVNPGTKEAVTIRGIDAKSYKAILKSNKEKMQAIQDQGGQE